jgi:hypothetical protein
MSDAPKTGKCYCGCDRDTDRHFYRGHDLAAASMFHLLKFGTTDVAEILRDAGYGPFGDSLREAAEAEGWKSSTGR